MKRLLHSTILRAPVLAVALGAVGLSGCTSLRGTQESALFSSMAALKADQKTAIGSRNYSYTKLVNYAGKTSAADKKQYRNEIMAVFMDAIDENYHIYSSRLFNEGLQFGLGFEGSIVGLAATAALFPDSAPELASVIAAAGGAQATVNKNLYFDRTLPALVTTMDTRRIEIETEIITKLKDEVADYPMAAALRDLRRYQNSGTLFRAVADVTGNAAENKKKADEKYEAQLGYSCDTEDDVIDQTDKIGRYYMTLAAAAAANARADLKLRTIAAVLNVSPSGSIADVSGRIRDKVGQEYCTIKEVQNLILEIEAATKDKL